MYGCIIFNCFIFINKFYVVIKKTINIFMKTLYRTVNRINARNYGFILINQSDTIQINIKYSSSNNKV